MLNSDYRDMLQCLLDHRVRFLLVGAYALAVHGYPRATKDLVDVEKLTATKRDSQQRD